MAPIARRGPLRDTKMRGDLAHVQARKETLSYPQIAQVQRRLAPVGRQTPAGIAGWARLGTLIPNDIEAFVIQRRLKVFCESLELGIGCESRTFRKILASFLQLALA